MSTVAPAAPGSAATAAEIAPPARFVRPIASIADGIASLFSRDMFGLQPTGAAAPDDDAGDDELIRLIPELASAYEARPAKLAGPTVGVRAESKASEGSPAPQDPSKTRLSDRGSP